MLARVATFNALPGDVDPEAVALLRTTVRESPGFVAGFHLGEPGGGKALSIVVVEDEQAARAVSQALADRPSNERVGLEPDTVEFFEAHPF
jgi:hypothetical protein